MTYIFSLSIFFSLSLSQIFKPSTHILSFTDDTTVSVTLVDDREELEVSTVCGNTKQKVETYNTRLWLKLCDTQSHSPHCHTVHTVPQSTLLSRHTCVTVPSHDASLSYKSKMFQMFSRSLTLVFIHLSPGTRHL